MHGWRRWRQWWRLASRIAPIQPAGPYVNCYKLSSFICLTRNAGQYISGISIKYPAWVLTRQMWCTLLLPNKMHQVGHTMTLNHANDFVIGPKSIIYIRPHPNSRSPTWATSQSTASLERCPGCENSCTSKDPIYVWENRAGCRVGIWLTQKTWYASWANCQALLRNGGQSVELEEAMHLQSGCHSLCLLPVAQPYLWLPLWDWTMGKDGCSLRYPWSFISSFRWGCFDTTS